MDKTSLDISSGTLFVRDSLSPRHVERNYVPLFGLTQSNVDLRNYVISRQIVIYIDPIHAVKSWNQASFSWIERHTEGDGTMLLCHRNVK